MLRSPLAVEQLARHRARAVRNAWRLTARECDCVSRTQLGVLFNACDTPV